MRYAKAKGTGMSEPIPIRFPVPTLRRLKALSIKMGESLATTIRQATLDGLVTLERKFETKPDRPQEIALVEERGPEYRISKKAGA